MKEFVHLRPKTKDDDGVLRVEIPGGSVVIRTGLKDDDGRDIVLIRVRPFDGPGGTDRQGRTWRLVKGEPEITLVREDLP